MTFRNFEQIIAWQTAREIVDRVYDISDAGAFARDFGLKDQARQAAISMMANIAEGFSRRSELEFAQYLFVAKGSAAELQSHLYIALDREYLPQDEFTSLYDKLDYYSRQVSRLITHLRQPFTGRTQQDAMRRNKT